MANATTNLPLGFTENLEPLQRLTRDLKKTRVSLGRREARYLVDLYYQIQDYRKRAQNQVRALSTSGEPHGLISWVFDANQTLEGDIKNVLGSWSMDYRQGRWARSIVGIGPVIAAGLVAHIDVSREWDDDEGHHVGTPTAGHLWRYAGLDPTVKWEKGQKRPWNASLKVLAWKIGESFIKQSGNESDVYGKVYVARKNLEWQRNLEGRFADQAQSILNAKNFRDETDARAFYSGKFAPNWNKGNSEQLAEMAVSDLAGFKEQGLVKVGAASEGVGGVPMLPPAHIHARARRYAVKLFFSHFHHVSYECAFGEAPPKPYILAYPEKNPYFVEAFEKLKALGVDASQMEAKILENDMLRHVHYIAPPNWPID